MSEPGEVLDYRRPGTPSAVSLERLVSILQQREAMLGWLSLMKIVTGLLASLVGPFLLASVVVVLEGRIRSDGVFSWPALFLLSSLVMIPLLCWYEWRTRGQFFMDFARGQGASTQGGMLHTSSRGEWELQTMASWAAMLEVMLFGPRLLLEGAMQYRARSALGHVNRVRAARLLWGLYVREQGLPVGELAEPGESAEALGRVLGFLQLLDYVDVSKKRERVWMQSGGRRRLLRAMGAGAASAP